MNKLIFLNGGGNGIRTHDPNLIRGNRLAGGRTRPLCDPSKSYINIKIMQNIIICLMLLKQDTAISVFYVMFNQNILN